MDNFILINGFAWTGYSSLACIKSDNPIVDAANVRDASHIEGSKLAAIAEVSEWFYGPRVKTYVFAREVHHLPSYQDGEEVCDPVLVPQSAARSLPRLEAMASEIRVFGTFAEPITVTERTAFFKECGSKNYYEASVCEGCEGLRLLLEPTLYFFFRGAFRTAFEIGEIVSSWENPSYDPPVEAAEGEPEILE